MEIKPYLVLTPTYLSLLKPQMYTAHNKFQIAPFYFYYDFPLNVIAVYLFI